MAEDEDKSYKFVRVAANSPVAGSPMRVMALDGNKRVADEEGQDASVATMKKRFDAEIVPKLAEVVIMASRGCNYSVISEFLGMSRQCFAKYRSVYPELQRAVDVGKGTTLDDVVDALYRKAVGYDYTETKSTMKKDASGAITADITEVWEKKQHADTSAAIFLLTNRRPEEWKRVVDPNQFAQSVSLSLGAGQISDDVIRSTTADIIAGLFKPDGIPTAKVAPSLDTFDIAAMVPEGDDDTVDEAEDTEPPEDE
jgi:hypothetical protein